MTAAVPPPLVVTDDAGVRSLVLNRPGSRNAVSRGLLAELGRQLDLARDDSAVRVVRVEGAGGSAFSAGLDLRELAALSDADALAFVRRGAELCDELGRFPKPLVAVIDGNALGGGLELAMACTLRVASDASVLGLPEVRLGLFPGWRGVANAARLVGPARAAELCLSGEAVDAATALAWGLVNQVVPRDRLAATADAVCRRLARLPPAAVRAVIRLLADQRGGVDEEQDLFGQVFDTPDARGLIRGWAGRP